MIKGISGTGKYISVVGGSPTGHYISPGAVGAGMMRYNPNMSAIEVNDGNSWQQLSTSYATVQMTPEAEGLLDWAREQRNKQYEYERLAKDHPAVQNAIDAIKRAEQQLELIAKLSIEYENEGAQVESS